jgi:hypothetical protein
MTLKRSAILLLVLALVAPVFAQSLQGYLALRKKYGIHVAVEEPALETLIGTRVMEMKGTVKGSFSVGGKYSLLVERSDGQSEVVDADAIPAWLQGGNEIRCRLIIRGSRSTEGGALHAVLLGAAAEDEIAAIEERERRTAAAIASKAKPLHSTGPVREWNLPASSVAPIYASFIKKENPRLSNSQALEIANGIIGFSLKYGVDARLIMAMVMVESDFNPREVSSAGAMGLGQLMPSNVQEMGVSNAYDTMQNLSATVRLVRGHLNDYHAKTGGKSFESLVLALAAYNAGPGAVRKYGGIPPYRETQNYVRKVLRLYYAFAGREAKY